MDLVDGLVDFTVRGGSSPLGRETRLVYRQLLEQA
jgi:hypothetical protein